MNSAWNFLLLLSCCLFFTNNAKAQDDFCDLDPGIIIDHFDTPRTMCVGSQVALRGQYDDNADDIQVTWTIETIDGGNGFFTPIQSDNTVFEATEPGKVR